MATLLAGDRTVTLHLAVRVSALLCAVTALVAAGELNALRNLTEVGGLLDTRIHRRGVLRAPFGLRGVVVLQAIFAGALAVAAVTGVMLAVAIAATTLLALLVALGLSLPWGRDGADEMTIIATAGCGVIAVGLSANSHSIAVAGAWFLTAVLCISYLSSGLAKLGGRAWRSGSALGLVMQTRSYGDIRVAALFKRYKRVGVAASYLMILGEIGFPIALVVPKPVGFAVLACGMGFHVLTAVIVRLNRFVPAFLASYPSMLWVLQHR